MSLGTAESPVKIDVGFDVAPSGGGMSLLLQEEQFDALVVLSGYAPAFDSSQRTEACAILTFHGVLQACYGYPNEEAYWRHPGGDLSDGVYELERSTWFDDISTYNERSFGAPMAAGWDRTTLHHYFVGSKDDSAQFLARGVEAEVFPGRRYRDVYLEAAARFA